MRCCASKQIKCSNGRRAGPGSESSRRDAVVAGASSAAACTGDRSADPQRFWSPAPRQAVRTLQRNSSLNSRRNRLNVVDTFRRRTGPSEWRECESGSAAG